MGNGRNNKPCFDSDKGLLNCAFKGEWDLFRKTGKGRSKIITISSVNPEHVIEV